MVEQARRQLDDLVRSQYTVQVSVISHLDPQVSVWAVLDYSRTRTIERELLLCKVSTLGPEYFEDQLATKIDTARMMEEAKRHEGQTLAQYAEIKPPTIEPGSPASASASAKGNDEKAAPAAHPAEQSPYAKPPGVTPTPPRESLTPSEALRQKSAHLSGIHNLANQFGGRIVDVSNDCVIVEVSGKTSRIDAFLKLIRPYGILEAARTGTMVMPRAPIQSPWTGLADDEPVEGDAVAMDAGMLPPG